MRLRRFSRAVTAAAVVFAIAACDDEFAPDPDGGFLASMEADGWPSGLTIGETITLRVAVVDEATGIGILPAAVDWSTTPPNAFQLIFADADSAVFRVLALGIIEIEASLDDPAFDTAAVSVTIPSRLAGVVVEASSEDSLRSIGEPLVVRARGIDANGDEIQVSGWTWTVRGGAVTTTGSQTLDSLRVVSASNGSAWIVASHAQCEGACADSVLVGVRQTPASIQLSVDSLLFESINAETDVTVTIRDALGQPMGDATDVVWEGIGAAISVADDSDGGSAKVRAEENGVGTVRVRLGALVDEIPVRVAQRAVALVARGGAGQTDTVASAVTDSLQVEARDAEGSPVAGVSIGWAVTPGAGSIIGSGNTGPNGRASASWTLGTVAGTQSAVAFIAGIDTVNFSATALPGPAAVIVATPDTVALAALGATSALAASVTDAFGNARTGTITWTSLTPSIATVGATGTVTAAGNGTARIEARVGSIADTVIVVVQQGAASVVLSIETLSFTSIGGGTQVTATVRDAGGSIVANPSGITWETTSASVATVLPLAPDSTQAIVTSVGNGSAFVRARIGGLSDEAQIDVQQVVASALVVGGADQTAVVGTLLTDSVRVEVRDALGSVVAGAQVTWAVLGSSGSVSGTGLTGANGRAAVAWTLGTVAGPQQLRAIVAGGDTVLIGATAEADAATQLTLTPPAASLTFLQDTVHLTARLRDQHGNAVPGIPAWSTSNGAIANVGPTGVVSATGVGVALVIAQADAFADTSVITVTQHVATITLSLNADTLAQGDTLRLTATARDSSGSVIVGAPIVWTSTDTLIAVVDASGRITARGRGPVTIRASSNGTTASASILVAAWALDFDGNDYVEVVNVPVLQLDSAFTIETWVRPHTGAASAGLVTMWGSTNTTRAYGLYLQGLVPTVLLRASGSSVDTVAAPLPVSTNAWHHIAFVYDEGVGTLYVDGAVVRTDSTLADASQSASPLRFGADATVLTGANFLDGELDDVRVWHSARSAAEIAASMSARLNPAEHPTLRAYWPLSEGSGNPVGAVGGLVGVLGGGLLGASPTWTLEASPVP